MKQVLILFFAFLINLYFIIFIYREQKSRIQTLESAIKKDNIIYDTSMMSEYQKGLDSFRKYNPAQYDTLSKIIEFYNTK